MKCRFVTADTPIAMVVANGRIGFMPHKPGTLIDVTPDEAALVKDTASATIEIVTAWQKKYCSVYANARSHPRRCFRACLDLSPAL